MLRLYTYLYKKAERQGFEPWEQLPVHRISSAARSTTPASFRREGTIFFLYGITDVSFFNETMKISLVQMNLAWCDTTENLRHAEELITSNGGADV